MPFSEDLIHAAQDLPTIVEQEIKQLEDRLKVAKTLRKFTTALALYVQSSKPLHILELQTKESKLLQQIQDFQPVVYADIQQIFKAAEQEAKTLEPFSVKFPRIFDQAQVRGTINLLTFKRKCKTTCFSSFFCLPIFASKS